MRLFCSYLRDNFKFIDPSRICAYGWGYGGYATAMTLIDDSQQVLQCGVAVNPIASFGYHCKFILQKQFSKTTNKIKETY